MFYTKQKVVVELTQDDNESTHTCRQEGVLNMPPNPFCGTVDHFTWTCNELCEMFMMHMNRS